MAVDTMSKVTKLVAERLGVEEAKVVPTAQFQEDLAADSLDMVELVMSLEEEFGLEIADDELEGIKTVQDAVDYIERHVP